MFESQINYRWSLENFKVSEILCVTTFYTICNPSFFKIVYTIPWGVIIIKRAKNHVRRLENCQFCHTYLCNAFFISCWLKKKNLNDLYECWQIKKKSLNLIIWFFFLLAFELEHQKINFIKHLTKESFNKEILMGKKIEMMITYHRHLKNTYNFKIVVLEIFRNSKYNLRLFKFKSHFLDVNGS